MTKDLNPKSPLMGKKASTDGGLGTITVDAPVSQR
jgi:hypothetical protein